MKTANVQSMRASLESAREYVTETQRVLEELRRRRAELTADVEALAAKPLHWVEAVDEIVDNAIDDAAARYQPSLGAWIRASNPNLVRRSNYDALPFLGVGDPSQPELLQSVGLLDGVSSHALCFFLPDFFKPRLRELLLTYPPPHPEAECISATDRNTQLAELRRQLRAVEDEIAQLQGELDQLKGF